MISDTAYDKAEYLGLHHTHEELERILTRMMAASAFTSHARGNRRFGDFVLLVKEGMLVDINVDNMEKGFCTECYGVGSLVVFDECPVCFGEKCEDCFNEGVIPSSVVCAKCSVEIAGRKRFETKRIR